MDYLPRIVVSQRILGKLAATVAPSHGTRLLASAVGCGGIEDGQCLSLGQRWLYAAIWRGQLAAISSNSDSTLAATELHVDPLPEKCNQGTANIE